MRGVFEVRPRIQWCSKKSMLWILSWYDLLYAVNGFAASSMGWCSGCLLCTKGLSTHVGCCGVFGVIVLIGFLKHGSAFSVPGATLRDLGSICLGCLPLQSCYFRLPTRLWTEENAHAQHMLISLNWKVPTVRPGILLFGIMVFPSLTSFAQAFIGEEGQVWFEGNWWVGETWDDDLNWLMFCCILARIVLQETSVFEGTKSKALREMHRWILENF